jgi:hypothetical protein
MMNLASSNINKNMLITSRMLKLIFSDSNLNRVIFCNPILIFSIYFQYAQDSADMGCYFYSMY